MAFVVETVVLAVLFVVTAVEVVVFVFAAVVAVVEAFVVVAADIGVIAIISVIGVISCSSVGIFIYVNSTSIIVDIMAYVGGICITLTIIIINAISVASSIRAIISAVVTVFGVVIQNL